MHTPAKISAAMDNKPWGIIGEQKERETGTK